MQYHEDKEGLDKQAKFEPLLFVVLLITLFATLSSSHLIMILDHQIKQVFLRRGYFIENKIGEGAYGMVYKATNLKNANLAAVKVINLSKMDENSKKKFSPREMAVIMESHHENLIQVYDIFKANQKMYIFMKFAGLSHYYNRWNLLYLYLLILQEMVTSRNTSKSTKECLWS